MVDITKCVWLECPIGGDCYRLQSKPNISYQSFGDFRGEYYPELSLCNYKINMKKGKENGNKEETYP